MKKRVYPPKGYHELHSVDELTQEYPFFDPAKGRYKIVETDEENEIVSETTEEVEIKSEKQGDVERWENRYKVFKNLPTIMMIISIIESIVAGIALEIVEGEGFGIILIVVGVGLSFLVKFLVEICVSCAVVQTEYQSSIR